MNKESDYNHYSDCKMNYSCFENDKNGLYFLQKYGSILKDIVSKEMSYIVKKYFYTDYIMFISKEITKRKPLNLKYVKTFECLVECDDFIIVNDGDFYPNIHLIEEFNNFKQSGEIFEYFPEYKDKKVYYIFSSLSIRDDLVDLLSNYGIYAMVLGDENMEILNFDKVK